MTVSWEERNYGSLKFWELIRGNYRLLVTKGVDGRVHSYIQKRSDDRVDWRKSARVYTRVVEKVRPQKAMEDLLMEYDSRFGIKEGNDWPFER